MEKLEKDSMEIFGRTLKRERESQGITQEILSEKVGMKRGTLATIEYGTRKPKFEDIFKFAEALEVSPAYLLTGNKEDNRKNTIDKLHLSDDAISEIHNMTPNQKKALEEIIHDDTIQRLLVAFFTGDYRISISDKEPTDKKAEGEELLIWASMGDGFETAITKSKDSLLLEMISEQLVTIRNLLWMRKRGKKS